MRVKHQTLNENAATCQNIMTKNVIERRAGERGFSVTEMLIVCSVILVVATLAVPALQKSIIAAENGNTFGSMRALSSSQVAFYSQNNRFGRLPEMNSVLSQSLGTVNGQQIIHGKFVFEMTPANPTDAELRNGYIVTATRNVASEGVIYKYEVNQAGDVRQILP
jgi:prepilin-type N-terminal cleavage/methylation domain-containing protein